VLPTLPCNKRHHPTEEKDAAGSTLRPAYFRLQPDRIDNVTEDVLSPRKTKDGVVCPHDLRQRG